MHRINLVPMILDATGLLNIGELKKKEKELRKVKEELEKSNFDSTKKQKIIKNLAKQNEQLKKELELEKKKNKSNAEKINLLEEMIKNSNCI
jgi:hypothetical protein